MIKICVHASTFLFVFSTGSEISKVHKVEPKLPKKIIVKKPHKASLYCEYNPFAKNECINNAIKQVDDIKIDIAKPVYHIE